MKILISCDMEGISGVVAWEQTEPGSGEYERCQALMTGDVNAAIRGAFDGGADEVLVADGHSYGRNLLLEELDPRVCLNVGVDKPLAIVEGIQDEVAAVIFIGYHSRIGTRNGLLCHTWSGATADLQLNEVPVGEIGLSAGVCGHFDAPVIMISADDTACAEARDLLGQLETVAVKRALGRQSAECLPLETARGMIYEAAVRAVIRLKAGNPPAPYRPKTPVRISLRFMRPGKVGLAELIPGTKVRDGRRIEYTARDMLDTFKVFRAYDILANSE
ncbi:MAG: M55 family metallopeptidase [Anaerolineales bacterium]|nr:M55 family metallopeptidase [Anaerolineales bacterium]